jgi:hypothetical protein
MFFFAIFISTLIIIASSHVWMQPPIQTRRAVAYIVTHVKFFCLFYLFKIILISNFHPITSKLEFTKQLFH